MSTKPRDRALRSFANRRLNEVELLALAAASEGAPADEDLAIGAVRAFVDADRRGEAIHCYQRCERALHENDRSPGDELLAAFRAALWQPPLRSHMQEELPHPVTRFIGRERERAEITAVTVSGATIVLTGPPGVGKTRLAIEIARATAKNFPSGMRYIEAASLDAIGIVRAMAAADAETESGEGRLLVIDNVEHVAEAVATAIDDTRATHPRLTMLVTSRVRLPVAGSAFVIAPLELPLVVSAPAFVARAPAIAFFVERVIFARPDFRVTDENVAEVSALCALLDGVPLALELAAAQMRFFSIGELLAHLRAHPTVHGESLLREQIAASFSLMEPRERNLALRLSVFDRRWTMDGARIVGGDEALELLPRLVDRSLVQAEEVAGETIFRFLESTYAYARAACEVAFDIAILERETLHTVRDVLLARTASLDEYYTPVVKQYLRLRLPTIRRAVTAWALRDPNASLEIMEALRYFWKDEGLDREAADILIGLAALLEPNGPPERKLAYLRCLGLHLVQLHELSLAEAILMQAVELALALGDEEARVACALDLGVAYYENADYEKAFYLYEELASGAIAQTMTWYLANRNWGNVAIATGDLVRAKTQYDLIESFPRQASSEANYWRNRACLATKADEHERAMAYIARALEAAESEGVGTWNRVAVYSAAGFSSTQAGDPRAALRWFARGIVELGGRESPVHMKEMLEDAACALDAVGRCDDAVVLLAVVDRERERAKTPTDVSAMAILDAVRMHARRALGEETYRDAQSRGRMMPVRTAAELVVRRASELPDAVSPCARLSGREVDVAYLVGMGATNREIAARLFVSAKTVEKHLAAIFNKLAVNRRSHVAAIVSQDPALRKRAERSVALAQ